MQIHEWAKKIPTNVLKYWICFGFYGLNSYYLPIKWYFYISTYLDNTMCQMGHSKASFGADLCGEKFFIIVIWKNFFVSYCPN